MLFFFKTMKRYIYLMRHGETEGNKLGVDQGGCSDSPLTAEGRKQCELARRFLEKFLEKNSISLDKIITSCLGRAVDSASIINKSFGVPVESYSDLNERNKGFWEGKKKSDYMTEELRQRMIADEDIRPPGGENYEDVANRVYPLFNKVLKENEGNLLFVVHGNVIRCLLTKIFDMPPALAYRIKQDNCCLNVLSQDEYDRLYIEGINISTTQEKISTTQEKKSDHAAKGLKEVLCVIQARGGSKGVPRKNIKPLCGKPLIYYTIQAAKKSKYITRTIVSTDDPEIAEISKAYGAEVPFLRPAEFATDKSKSIELFVHLMDWLKTNENYEPDVVVQLKPTNPLRTEKEIDESLEKYFSYKDIDSLLTMHEVKQHPYKMWVEGEGGLVKPFVDPSTTGFDEPYKMPRQLLPKVYGTNSAVNIMNPKTITELKSTVGKKIACHVLEGDCTLNIDTQQDFDIAEIIMKRREKNEY